MIVEGVALSIIAGLIMHSINKIDALDKRIDRLSERITRIESLYPKRKTDRDDYQNQSTYHSPNSGIDL